MSLVMQQMDFKITVKGLDHQD